MILLFEEQKITSSATACMTVYSTLLISSYLTMIIRYGCYISIILIIHRIVWGAKEQEL